MRLHSVSKLALVVATVAVAVGFAQAQKQPKSESLNEKSAVSKTMSFNAADVQGYLETPSLVSILDINDADQSPITLNRSFKDALRENMDRESMERVSLGAGVKK